MWHSSVARHSPSVTDEALELCARLALEGVGDAGRGEWIEVSPRAVHVRRRISVAEERRVPDVCDIRGTLEVAQRLKAVRHVLPLGWHE